jgi:uncharacterized GH25 family protein
VRLALDWGDHEFAGRVLDDRGEPVAGADVVLAWFHDDAGSHSTSNRELRTDDGGRFRFTRLGPGRHTLDVTAIKCSSGRYIRGGMVPPGVSR